MELRPSFQQCCFVALTETDQLRYFSNSKGRVTSVQKGSIPNKIGKEGRDEANDFKKKATKN